MSFLESLAKVEHSFRPLIAGLPPMLATRLFSRGRTYFSERFALESPLPRSFEHDGVTAWGLRFRMPIWNAAGMFKKGEGYNVVVAQGAGAYVAGTTTSRPREGNVLRGIQWPAVPYARSGAASNWMGLPNEGHAVVASRLSKLVRVEGCPIGASVSMQPGLDAAEGLSELVAGMEDYDRAGVDYIELNESCPNVESHAGGPALDAGLLDRLEYVSQKFLRDRSRSLPVVVKFSVDTDPDQLEDLLGALVTMRYDGIILGNTSTAYLQKRSSIHTHERTLYDRFTTTFGGGLSGRMLNGDSLMLSSLAISLLATLRPEGEFNVIRCGGVFDADDIVQSHNNGVLLNQWYTGYFDAFARHGHDVYKELAWRLQGADGAGRNESRRLVNSDDTLS